MSGFLAVSHPSAFTLARKFAAFKISQTSKSARNISFFCFCLQVICFLMWPSCAREQPNTNFDDEDRKPKGVLCSSLLAACGFVKFRSVEQEAVSPPSGRWGRPSCKHQWRRSGCARAASQMRILLFLSGPAASQPLSSGTPDPCQERFLFSASMKPVSENVTPSESNYGYSDQKKSKSSHYLLRDCCHSSFQLLRQKLNCGIGLA